VYNDFYTSTSVKFEIEAGKSYHFWVHYEKPDGSWSPAYESFFTAIGELGSCGKISNGGIVARTMYRLASPASGQLCEPQIQTALCTDGVVGTFSGTYQNETCNGVMPRSCLDTQSGEFESRIMYQSATVASGQSCVKEIQKRLCSDGTFGAYSGTYTKSSCAGPHMCQTIVQHGITWNLDKSYPCGQFANGDYWVEGPVVIKSIFPIPIDGRNGFDINPASFDVEGFTYDSRVQGYKKTSAPQKVPVTVPALSSLVSTTSATNPVRVGAPEYGSQQFYQSRFGAEYESRSVIRTAAVLTVLDSAPANYGSTFFRPPYNGSDKKLYSTLGLRTDKLLSLAPVANTPSIAAVAAKFERVQIDHNSSYLGAYMHPVDNMANYGAAMTNDVGNAILRLSLNDSVAAKMPLLIGIVQSGIDHMAMLKSGTFWTGDGGHFSGRKLQILFAGLMLTDSEMLNIGIHYSENKFAEDCQTFYTTQNPPAGFYSALDPKYGPNFARYEIKHCSPGDYAVMWNQNRIGEELGDGSTYYQINYGSWIGEVLAIQLYGLKGVWNHNAFPDLVNRTYETLGFSFGSYMDPFNNSMWTTYRQ
jgi:hypothetical protein